MMTVNRICMAIFEQVKHEIVSGRTAIGNQSAILIASVMQIFIESSAAAIFAPHDSGKTM